MLFCLIDIHTQASHPALQGSLRGGLTGGPMRASVLLSVQCEYSDNLAEMMYLPDIQHNIHIGNKTHILIDATDLNMSHLQ